MPNANDIRWFKDNFRASIEKKLAGSPFDVDMIVAISCQETGYIWSVLRRRPLSISDILALCVGDTIDSGRKAFPTDKKDLLSAAGGQAMFDIARTALEQIAVYFSDYEKAAKNPTKFCHGFGVFQRDIQFFVDDPDYFLQKRYENFDNSLDHCLSELNRGLKRLDLDHQSSLTDDDFYKVAIAYNTGKYKPEKGLKQGYFDGKKFYGENIRDYVVLSRQVTSASSAVPGRYTVMARSGLRLRGGPGTSFPTVKLKAPGTGEEVEAILPVGTVLTVLAPSSDDPAWVKVDLQDDGLYDGFVLAEYLHPVTARTEVAAGETAPEPE